MPPKKSPKPNGFSLFAQDLMKQHGKQYKTMKEACEGAAPLWAKMSPEQKRPYDSKAKGMRGDGARYTSEGINVNDLAQEFSAKNAAEVTARANIRARINEARNRQELDTETFFVVHCNFFCYYNKEDRYWPAEIAVLAFNLRDGVKPENIFHSMVHPGALPIGYAYEAKQHSEQVHQIAIPTDDQQPNMSYIYYELKTFIEERTPPGAKMPVFYSDKKISKAIQNVLNTWALDYNEEQGSEEFSVYDLQVLLFYLRNACASDEVWPSINFSDRELEKDVYAYVPEIVCDFHSASEKLQYCSKSIVCRYAFITCDNCCPDLGIQLIEGEHIPIHSTVPESRGSSRFRSKTSQSGRSSRSGFATDSDASSDKWETRSVSSQYSDCSYMTNLEDDFPSLDNTRSQSRASNYSGISMGGSTVKSYAGATGRTGLPCTNEREFANLSLASNFNPAGSPWGNDLSNSGVGTSVASQDFPPISKGRGFRRPTSKKPGLGGEKP